MTAVARLRDLLDKATSRPWVLRDAEPWIIDAPLRHEVVFAGPQPPDPNPVAAERDAALIVALINCADELLAVADLVRKHLDDYSVEQEFVDALAALDRKLADQ